MTFKKKLSWITVGLLCVTSYSQSCTKKPEALLNRIDTGGQEFANQEPPGPVTPVEAEKFDAERQNEIFSLIVDGVSQETCTDINQRSEARLITANEYIQSVESSFGIDLDDEVLKISLPTETVQVLAYDHLSNFNKLSRERLERYLDVNVKVAEQIQSDAGSIIDCGQPKRDCIESWLSETLPKIWRMKIDGERLQQEMKLVDSYGTDVQGLGLLVERILLSHNFLFRKQLGLDGHLDSWEVATVLADSLWASPPSSNLVALAESDSFNNQQSVRQQAQSMINDPKFYEGVKRFVSSWLMTKLIDSKDFEATGNSEINADIKAILKEESAAFIYFLVKSERDQFSEIFDANFTMGDEAFAEVYGLTVGSNDIEIPGGLKPLSYSESRQGILSQPSLAVITSNLESTNPPKRGKHIMEKFLCQSLETPENLAEVVANTPFDKSLSVVDAFHKATSNGSCGECHSVVNGVGFGMEDIGPDGRIQSTDSHGFDVMTPGNLFISMKDDQSKTFSGVAGLSQTLKGTKEVEVCLAVQAFRMIYGRLEKERDVCTITNAYKRASSQELEFDKLFVEMIVERSRLTK
ncbi:DUF1592 domain-containing protein [Pseudobacteriovorax antillogorgiicola]|uniref:DUF1592 domain-containing protein n=1 Tax=Pseudobacteriovorax antillogorgiicola TaxID=1513793 RepID=A0A1Y6B9K0_9BACT|nr:DUF1592 domain-containing protein [Pseudobacteriovorax antillogorgiicola]TCS57520.1 uncharacterized protein DUF1588 [Pseudobacteriovorax antillogorgiicola]SMF00111.1 Protein of unknown function [Pseudobacteriovorax antillogorgiicola]